MLTCACGARFEVADSLAGQEVLCPECQQPLQAPAAVRPPLVTSGWALASVLLALMGAFTVLGTLVAIVLGIIALVSIARHRDRVTGVGFAVFGICLGVLFTVLTVVALNAADVFGLESWMRQRTMTQEIDTTGPLEVVQGNKGFAITRPTEKWGQMQSKASDDPAVGAFQTNLDLLLMQIPRHAFVDVRVLPGPPFQSLDQCETEVLADFEGPRQLQQMRDPFEDDDEPFRPAVRMRRLGSRQLAAVDGMAGRQAEVEVRCAGKPWHFIIRLYRRGNGRIYVVRSYAPKRRFDEVRGELERALDSFRILRR
ncbi:MAG TPA: DUF4190 domain-containing protein [Gemmataceae bacterium]|nr:DUF4190 domain-containing protein [Gemmataceae bacterium]